MTSISVIMCTYNGEQHVAEQLRSILEQSVTPSEVLVSDDGSTDATLDVVSAIAAESPIPVRVHRNSVRLGYADNFLEAATRARGNFIAFSDQDDRWSARKLEVGYYALVREDAILSTHRVRFIDDAGRVLAPERSSEPGWRVLEPLTSNPWGNFYGFTMLFRASLLSMLPASDRGLDVHSLEKPLAHDRWVYFLATTFGRTVVLNEVLADYRQHGRQLYGGEVARSLRERVRTKMDHGEAQARKLAAVARHRAALLEERSTDPISPRAAERWRSLASYLEDSAELYNSDISALRRLSLLVSSVRRGAYRPLEDGGLGYSRLAEDMTVLGAQTLTRRH